MCSGSFSCRILNNDTNSVGNTMESDRLEFTVEEVAEGYFDFVRAHSGSEAFKKTSKAIKYKTNFFTPKKKRRLIEELLFFHRELALKLIKLLAKDQDLANEINEIFDKKFARPLGVLMKGDTTASDQFHTHSNEYRKLLSKTTKPVRTSFLILIVAAWRKRFIFYANKFSELVF